MVRTTPCLQREVSEETRLSYESEQTGPDPSGGNSAGGIHEAARVVTERLGARVERAAPADQRDRVGKAGHHRRHGIAAGALLRDFGGNVDWAAGGL